MAFPVFQRPVGTVAQTSPLGGLVANALQTYQAINQAQYQRPNLEEALKKAKLFNQYYGPNIESEMALRGAQTGESGARTGLIGEQTKGARIENQFLPQKIQAQLAQALLQQQLLNQVMGGMGSGQQQAMQPEAKPYSPGQGMGMLNEASQMQPSMQQPMQPNQQSMSQGSMTYPQSALAMKLLGLGQPKIENINGKYTAFTPFGNIEVAQGPSLLQQELSKSDAKKIAEAENTVIQGSKIKDTLGEVANIISSPTFEAMRQNPVLGRHELGYFSKFGTPEQQEAVGAFKAFTGDIIKASARDFAGQFRIGEQALLSSMKPNESDSLDVIKGKTEALVFMVNAMTERAQLQAELMRNQGLNPLQAKREADKVFSPEQLKKEIHDKIYASRKPTREGALAELERRKSMGQFMSHDVDYAKLSNEELMQIVNSSPSEESAQQSPNFLSNALQGYGNYLKGAAHGAGQSLGDFGASAINWPISGAEKLLGKELPHVPHPNLLNPHPGSLGESIGQHVGGLVGNIIPGLIGGGVPQLMSKGAPAIAKLLMGAGSGALTGAAGNEDNRELGGITGGIGGAIGATIPGVAKYISHLRSKNIAHNVTNAMEEAQDIYGQKFRHIMTESEARGAHEFPKIIPMNDKLLKKAGNKDLLYALEQYKLTPNIQTAHAAQSDLGKFVAAIGKPTSTLDRHAVEEAKHMSKSLREQIVQHLEKSGNGDLSEGYKIARHGYRKDVVPYLQSPTIKKYLKGEVRPGSFASKLANEEKFMSQRGVKNHPELRHRQLGIAGAKMTASAASIEELIRHLLGSITRG